MAPSRREGAALSQSIVVGPQRRWAHGIAVHLVPSTDSGDTRAPRIEVPQRLMIAPVSRCSGDMGTWRRLLAAALAPPRGPTALSLSRERPRELTAAERHSLEKARRGKGLLTLERSGLVRLPAYSV